MYVSRRDALRALLASASFAAPRAYSAPSKPGMPGPYPGRVVAVEHSGAILNGSYQKQAIDPMMRKGMTELTGAPSWTDAWRALFQKGDVVGIKVSPVGGKQLSSDALVMHSILDGLREAGIPPRDIVVFNRYRKEIPEAGIDKWLPENIRWEAPSEEYNDVQLDMGGYDPDHYMEMALIKPGENLNDPRFRRSYVAKVVTRKINKIVNLCVLKHHGSAGVTIALKNLSHGLVNNVNRSHLSPTQNACGVFIPAVVSLPVIRQKAVLHICDGVKASCNGGPWGNAKYMWEHKTMYFATDPVALDKTGWKVIDAERVRRGMSPLAIARDEPDAPFLHKQVEHIEIASTLGLGVFDDKKIEVRRIQLL